MTLDYLKKLHVAYEEFIADIARSTHVVRVDYSEFRSAQQMVDEIVRQRSESQWPMSPTTAVEWATREPSP